MMSRLKKLYDPHSLIVTVLIFVSIYAFQFLYLNLHFLDPFNNGIKDYEVTDIVYSQLRDRQRIEISEEIILVNTQLIPRDTLARVLQAITRLEPRAVGIDILLDGRKEPKADSALQAAIRDLPRVVLAGALAPLEDDLTVFDAPDGVDPYFASQAPVGYINFVAKDTGVIRLFTPFEQTTGGVASAFGVALAAAYDSTSLQRLKKRNNTVERIFFNGDQDRFRKLNYRQLLDSSLVHAMRASGVFEDKLFILGYIGNHEPGEPEIDRFFTPLNPRYSGRSYPDMYGAVIHANIAQMVLSGTYINTLPQWLIFLGTWIYAYLNVFLIHRIYRKIHEAFHGITRLLQITEFIVVFFLIALLFNEYHLKIDFTKGILAMVLSYDFVMIYESLIKKKIKFLQNLST